MSQRRCICLLTIITLLFATVFSAEANIQCYQCHGTSSPVDYRPLDASYRSVSSGAFQGNHRTHLSAPSSHTACTPCHPGSDTYVSSHRNGLIKVSGHINGSPLVTPYNNTTSAFPQTSAPALGSCASVNCHFEATTPTWGVDPSLTTCSTCHNAPPGDGSHPKHATYYGTGSTSCLKCHQNNAGFAHATSAGKRPLNVSFSTAPNSGGSYTGSVSYPGYLPSQSPLRNGTCTGLYCHSNGAGGAPVVVPVWGATMPVDCTGCHGGALGSASAISTGKHTAHINNSAILGTNFGCADCHAKTVSGNTTISTLANHVNGYSDYSGVKAGRSSSYTTATGVCTATYCHTDGKGTAKSMGTDTWKGATTLSCKGCHGSDATPAFTSSAAGEPNYANSGANVLKSNNHQPHTKNDPTSCDACHTATTTTGLAIKGGSVTHINKSIDVTFNTTKAGASVTWTAGTKTCSNISCHGAGSSSAQWGSTSCLGCHSVTQGNRAAITSQFSANSHHIQGTVTDDKCYQCHWEANSDGSINSAYHHSGTPGAPVELVVYGAGTRPVTYTTSSFLAGISNAGGGAWTKAAPVVINNTTNSSNLKNYQEKITVTYDSDMKSDFSDLRFFDGTTELSYWIESYSTSASAAVWVKVPSIPASSSKTITMYYGNPLAASSSNAGLTLIPNSITALEGNCTDGANCAYTDNHTEANSIRAYPANIGTKNVSKIYWGSVWDGTSPGSNVRDYFFSRFRYLFVPDVSGAWQFAVDSDDASELILNPNDLAIPSGETVIASTYGPQGWSNSQIHSGTISLTAGQTYWMDYLQSEWGGGEAAVLWVKRPGDSWKNLSTQNYANMIYSRKYTSPEPTSSIGAEQSVNISNIVPTAIQYTANNTRTEIQKINYHCLGCHSDQNNTNQPFGDGKTPKQYAWDGTSVAARYSQTGVTQWDKYNVSQKASQTKAFSAHGNSVQNQGGWDTSETWPDTRSSVTNVSCYDCHNSHGSSVSGTTTSYGSATVNAGILKDTLAGKGGYSQSYKPASGGSSATKNAYTAGAGLCFDCHQNATTGTTPWGYSDTYGATQKIIGYWDTDYFGPGTFGSQTRYPFKAAQGHRGGHFGASSTLSSSPSAAIGGICTPCHDPHGVSPTLGVKQQYAVPLLKGTWFTSPYKEDTAPAVNDARTGLGAASFHIDQNTFGSSLGDTIPASTFRNVSTSSGLCLGCHPKSSLTDGTTHTWKNKNRIHESVNGWKSANGTIKHNYSCSKCHAVHNSRLPRLMVTDCLDSPHKGLSSYNASATTSWNSWGSGSYGNGSGIGRIPGVYSGSGTNGNYAQGPSPGTLSTTCHESPAANNHANSDLDQSWNTITNWALIPPTVTSTSPNARGKGGAQATVTITGTGFQSGATVSFNDPNITLGVVNVVNATTITVPVTVTASATLGAHNVTVTNPDGGSGTGTGKYTVNAGPTVTSTSPGARGKGGALTTVTITGTGFQSGASVSFNDPNITLGTVTFVNATSITVPVTVTSTANLGAHDVTVTNPDGGNGTGTGVFTVNAGPTVTATSPTAILKGSAPTTVTITGTGFQSGATVNFNDPNITLGAVTVVNATTITVPVTVTASATLGAHNVTVTNTTDGGSGIGTNLFSATVPPTVTSTSPNTRGKNSAQTTVTITGTGFQNGATVSFNDANITVGTVTVVSATSITVPVTVTASATLGGHNVTVTNTTDGGSGTGTGVFTVTAAPTVTATSPNARGIGSALTTVTITGTGFQSGATASFNDANITIGAVTVVNATTITVPVTVTGTATAGLHNVTVTNSDGGSGTGTGLFTVNAAPTVTSTSPNARIQGSAQTTVTITGTGFQSGATVSFNDANITLGTVTVVNATTITVPVTVTAAATVGAHNVTVTNADGGSGTGTGLFTVIAGPTVTSVSPNARLLGSGLTTVTITGAGFQNGATVSFNDANITLGAVTVVNATTITVPVTVTASATVGAHNVTVTNPDGGSGIGTGVFTASVPPTVTTTSPNVLGRSSGPATITITGTGFQNGATVSFNDANITLGAATVTNATTITVPVTIAASATLGVHNVTVTNADSGTGTGTGVFTVTVPPPPAPTVIAHGNYDSGCAGTVVTVSWNTVSSPDSDPVQYYVHTDNYGDSGWLPVGQTSWSFTNNAGGSVTWQVVARDSVHTDAASTWSGTDYFYDAGSSCPKSSCPLVYSWNGAEFIYETDLQGPAISQIKKGARNVTLYQPSYIVLEGLVPDTNNQYLVNIWESLPEATLLDEAKLLVVDYPAGYRIASSGAENTYYYGYTDPFKIYTLKDPVPPITANDKYGNDVMASVLAVDNNTAPMNSNDPDNYYTFDFGTIQHPENAKLVIDGWQDINSKKYSSTITIQPYVEVVDTNGAWVKVKTFGMPMGDLKTMVIDLVNKFLSTDHRVRLHLGIKKAQVWVFDRIRLDDSAPVSVTVQELQASSADLQFGGNSILSIPSLQQRMVAVDVGSATNPDYFGYGNFTRYGEVAELLTLRDDKYVILNYADKLKLKFPAPSAPQAGMTRGFILKADNYYKDFKDYKYLDPLPFHGMSDYPPPAPEAYPTDADHNQYRLDYNTRTVAP